MPVFCLALSRGSWKFRIQALCVTILPLGHMASRTRVIFYFYFLHVSPSVSSFISYVVSPPFCIHQSVSFNDVFLSPLPSVTCMILIHVLLIFITELEYINTSRTTFIPQSTLCNRLLDIQGFFLRILANSLDNKHLSIDCRTFCL
jgi:hypothetical protein